MNRTRRSQVRNLSTIATIAVVLMVGSSPTVAGDSGLTRVTDGDNHPYARPWPVHLESFRADHVTDALFADTVPHPAARQWPVHLQSFREAGPTETAYTDGSIHGRAKHWPMHSLYRGDDES